MSALVTEHLPLLASAPEGIKKLRGLILELAVRGKLVPQDPNDEPASEVLKRLKAAEDKGKSKFGILGSDRCLPFALPKSWCSARFGEIARHNSGKTLDKGRNSGVARDYLTTSNLYWGRFDLANVRQMLIEESDLERCTASKGDLLICEGGEAGRAAVWENDWDVCFQNHVHRARFRAELNPYFYQRYFERLNYSGEISEYRKGVGISNMSGKSLASIVVPVPPVKEQQRIVAKVDELMALCDRLEAQQDDAAAAHAQLMQTLLNSLTRAQDADDFAASWQRLSAHFDVLFTTEASIDALKQAILQLAVMGKLVPQDPSDEPVSEYWKRIKLAKQTFLAESAARKQKDISDESIAGQPFEVPAGWVWVLIDDVFQVTGGVTLGRKLAGRKLVSMPYLRVANVQRGRLELNQVKEVEVPEDEVDKYRLRYGDLLIAEGGDWDKVGRTAIWRDELSECLHQNHVFRARAFVADFDPIWSEMYLNSRSAREYFASSSKQTTNLASINMTQLRSCVFPMPPIAEQRRIVVKANEFMGICDQLMRQLKKANQLHEKLAGAMVEQAVA